MAEEIWGKTVIPGRKLPRMNSDYEDQADREAQARAEAFNKRAGRVQGFNDHGGDELNEAGDHLANARSRLLLAHQSQF